MGLVDLRGREGEPALHSLLAGAGDPGRVLLGWDEEGELAGCIGIGPVAERELELRLVFVAEPFRGRGIGRALVEAVVAGAPADRFVGPAGFLERCGFTLDAGGARCSRFVPAVPGAADAVAAVTLAGLEAAIRRAWGLDTSADPDDWTAENPARGQCDATAAVVRSYLGGEILVADVLRDGARVDRHAWNRLPGGLAVDLTREQFRRGEVLGEPAVREPLLLGDARQRHALLAGRVAAALGR